MCSNEEDTNTIVERFKKDYNEQFFILIRMHLSFLLDTQTDDNDSVAEKGRIKKWNLVPFSKKSKLRNVMEGAPLTQEGVCQIFHLIEFLKNEDSIKSEGIFRRTGSLERQQDLKSFLNQGSTIDTICSGNYSVHDCASVLKGFLQELPEPLLTEGHFPVYCQLADLYCVNNEILQEQKLLEALQLLILLLPTENKHLLKDILELLHLTSSHEKYNRMSPDNLAKLFTPHLLCPRSLSPTVLLKVSQNLFTIVSFMIKRFPDLFGVPAKLILDFRAKYEKKQILSPVKHLNESTADVASTVFTFVDQERTARENESNPTETALAQLYAHIQSLPESSKKRKLIKQFNKENGYGTPLQVIKNNKNKSFGDSIKKHIFQKHLARKKRFLVKESPIGSRFNSPSGSPSLATRARLLCHFNCESSTDIAAKRKRTSRSCERLTYQDECEDEGKSFSEPEMSEREDFMEYKNYLTSTPACFPLKVCDDFTPDRQGRKSMSPITMSAQRMPRAMQETMMTPRSRKPVLLLSGTNINSLPKTEQSCTMDDVTEEKFDTPIFNEDHNIAETPSFSKCQNIAADKIKSEGAIVKDRVEILKMNKTESGDTLSDTFKEYLSNRDIVAIYSPQDSSFSSRTDDFNSTEFTNQQLTDSLLYCLDGKNPENLNDTKEEKQLVLKPKQFDKNGKPIIFETSF
ncbi:rho GTPase-activating protein 19-like [Diorhabda carinulata]|uniref:rho GTPase-activating protein 19-like n=1 Tax=Diorhabda carinulata TaxID=1163345 RepID=UPI0025A10469|nr:rho GTPase-activating protein 19-like [Diorhabda carinulata]